MLRAARAILRSEDLAWDAVQEALLRAWRPGARDLPSGGALRRLAALSALHLARCGRRRTYHEDRRAADARPCCAQDPLADVASVEIRQELRAALARLTEAYRVVFELYELDGCGYHEIAARLALPIGTVRSRLARARRALRTQLTDPALAG
jgi:RNA polymerase sigma-70 factor (ECF subfamily)